MLRYGEEIGRLLLTAPGYSAYVRTFSCRRGQTIRMVTATNVTFLTVASSHRPLVPAGSTLNTLVVLNRRLRGCPRRGELTPDEWARRPPRKRYLDNVMRLTSALQ